VGYFDSIKEKSVASTVAAPSNVIQFRENLHPYARAIRDAWLSRLDQLERPWVKGAAWDSNCFVTARKLVELANSPWAGYALAEAETDYMAHAPYDNAWDKREKCWGQASRTAQHIALPEPDPQAPLPVLTVLQIEEQVAAGIGPPLNPIIDWHELFAGEDQGEEWIIEPLLPARRMVALYSAPKAGKSLLMLELAVAMARGTKVLGADLDRPYRVLYVDFENDPQGDIRTRLEAMGEAEAGRLGNLCYLTFPSLAKFDTAQGAIDLMRHVEHYECEIVVIDTVSRAVAGEENENDTWLSFYRHTGLSLKRAGIACIRLDHSGKDREKGMRGGSAKYGDVDAVWRLTALNENTIHLECTDNRMPVPVKSMTLVRQDFPLSHLPAGDSWQAVADAKTQWADQRLEALGVAPSASVREAGKALREAGDKVENRAVREAVRMRKLRLDLPSVSVPGTPPAHSGTPGGSVPGTAPPKGAAGTPPAAVPERHGTGPDDPDMLVGCESCFKPTSAGVAGRNDGRCFQCAKDAGMEIT
jgi:hypothetical protein